MSNVNAVDTSQSNWPTSNQRPAASDKEPLANVEIQKLTDDIEKEASELTRINQEFSQYLADGAQDKAKLKSVEMVQKQMQIQSMRLQISKLEKPKKGNEAANSAVKDSADSSRPKFDRFIKSSEQPEETPGIYHLEQDENGNPKIVFDRSDSAEKDKPAGNAPVETQAAQSPEAALKPDADATEPEKAEKENEPEKPGGKETEGGYGSVNTDKVDAEIKKLQTQKQQAQQGLNHVSGDEGKRKEAEQRLAQIEAELSAKDTDAYRKTNASFTYSSTPI